MADKKFDVVQRGSHRPSPLGTSLFVLLRAVEPFLQLYLLLTSPLTTLLLPRLGIRVPAPPSNDHVTSFSSASWPLSILSTLSHSLNLNLPPMQTLLFLMSCLAALKQINWIVTISKEEMPVSAALIIAAFNAVSNTLNTLLFTLVAINPTYPPLTSPSLSIHISISSLLFLTGLAVEALSESQRRRFKDDAHNQGKLYMGGLFALARSVNYGGYTVWRAGFALAGGGPVWAALVAGFFFWNFGTRSLPVMEEYCEKRYGSRQWEEFKKRVPYRLIPGVY